MYLAQNKDNTLLVDLAFIDYPGWFGGKARSVQLKELIEEKGYQFKKVELSKPNKWQVILYGIAFFLRFGYFKPFGYRSFVNSAYLYFGYTQLFKQYPGIQIVIKEGTGYGDLVIVDIIKKIGRKIYLIPADIESLCEYPNAWTHTLPKIKRFEVELKYYRKADAVFCISEEESWILRIFEANAYFLPYYPSINKKDLIEKRRINRQPDKDFGILTFGRFDNTPQRRGLLNLLEDIKKKRIQLSYNLNIAGVGSEYFIDVVKGINNIKVLGELSDNELEECLYKCIAVLFYHKPTGGMITRVPDMLLSGIPIIGNEDALKSYIFSRGTSLLSDKIIIEEVDYETIEKKKSYFYSNFFKWI